MTGKSLLLVEEKRTMVVAGRLAFLVLLLSFAFGVADAIRALKDGPMIDAEGREYKSPNLGSVGDDSYRPQPRGGSTVRVHCTETSMIIVVRADLVKNGRLVSPGELFLGEGKYWQSPECQAAAAGYGTYIIEAKLQACGSKLSVSC